jgi:hypothetical protein
LLKGLLNFASIEALPGSVASQGTQIGGNIRSDDQIDAL